MLLFSDETGFSLHPKLGRIWSKRGTQPVVLTKSAHHRRLNIFGWVDPVITTVGDVLDLLEKGETAVMSIRNVWRKEP